MATTTRLLRTSRPSHHVISSSSSSSLSARTVRCTASKAGFNGDKRASGNGDKRKSTVPVKASVTCTSNGLAVIKEPEVDRGIDLASLSENVTNAMLVVLRPLFKRRPWRLQIQMFVERVAKNMRWNCAGYNKLSILYIICSCRILTRFIIVFCGGLLSFCKVVLPVFQHVVHKADQAHIMHLLIEAIDTFLVGTAMLIFGVGLYVMFVRSKNITEKGAWLPNSNLFGLFALKTLPEWVELESISQAKSRIGYAVMTIIQVGVLEKFSNIPMVTSLDLACFAGAVLISSACIFLLSRLSIGTRGGDR